MRTVFTCSLVLVSLIPICSCFSREKRGSGPKSIPITDGEKTEIVQIHNDLRMLSGASNMRYMSWDSELAWIAEQYSKKCQFSHNPERKHTRIPSVGENIYATSVQITGSDSVKAVKAWYDEISYFDYNTRTCLPGKMCGHYTQVVWATTYKVGCAMTSCDFISDVSWGGGGTIFICNYGTAGNVVSAVTKKMMSVFEKGSPCSKCDPEDYCRGYLCANSARDFIEEPKMPKKEPDQGNGWIGLVIVVVLLSCIVVFLAGLTIYRERHRISVRMGFIGGPGTNPTRFSNQSTPVPSRLNTPRTSMTGNTLHGMQRFTAADIVHPIEKIKAGERSCSAPTTPRRGYTKGTHTPPRAAPPAVPPPPLIKR